MIDQNKRDSIISETAIWNYGFIEKSTPSYGGGIALFSGLKVETLKKLINEGFADLEDAQNESPTLKEFFDFLEKNPEFSAEGYAVSAEREDCRITITGVLYTGKVTESKKKAFLELCSDADELTVEDEYLRSWYD